MIASNNLREPYETINLAEFKLVREIGKGTFGRIYEVIWIINMDLIIKLLMKV